MHPLLGSLTNLTDDELYTKLSELQKRYTQAWKMGGAQMMPQIQMLIEDYNAEISKRNAKKMEELQAKLDKKTNKDGKGIKGIIDIK